MIDLTSSSSYISSMSSRKRGLLRIVLTPALYILKWFGRGTDVIYGICDVIDFRSRHGHEPEDKEMGH